MSDSYCGRLNLDFEFDKMNLLLDHIESRLTLTHDNREIR